MNARDKTATLYEILLAWWNKGGSKPPPTPVQQVNTAAMPTVFNPLKFAVGGFVRIQAGGLDARTFSVENVEEYTRRIGTEKLVFTDYVFLDTDGKEETWATVRVIPKTKGGYDCLLLSPRFESGYTDELAKALEGDTLKDDESEVIYRKLGQFKASVREISADGTKRRDVEYWDFINEEEAQPRFYLVEMDLSDRKGWIQTFLGTPIAIEDVAPISGHTSQAV